MFPFGSSVFLLFISTYGLDPQQAAILYDSNKSILAYASNLFIYKLHIQFTSPLFK